MKMGLAIMILISIVGCGIGLYEMGITDRLMTGFIPADGDIKVDLNKWITFVVPVPIDPTTLTAANVIVSSGATTIPGTLSYDAGTLTVTFTPTAAYPQNALINVSIRPGLKYADGVAAAPQSIAFTTLSQASLIAMWKFDGDGVDSSMHGNDLTLTNTTFNSTTQYEGTNSIVFNGTNAFGITSTAVDLGSRFSITVWVKMSDPIQNSCNGILTNVMGGLNTNGFKVFVNQFGTSDLTINTEAGDGVNGATLSTQTGFVTLAVWKQVAFTVDKSAPAAQRALFYFGGQPATQNVSNTVGSITTFPSVFETNSSVVVGAFKTPHLFFKGEMDDMRIYNDVLSPAEVLQISQQH